MNQTTDTMLQKALANPGRVFDTPEDVFSSQNFTKEEKKKILTNWKDQHIQLTRATNEGMEAQNPENILRQISNAIEKLES